MESVVIFGGTGFIGTHLTQFLLRECGAQKIVLVDLNPPRRENYTVVLQDALTAGRVVYVKADVRQPLSLDVLPSASIVFNLAAVHREPGHLAAEYYESNLMGAEHVCAYAAACGCSRIVFTSSISPYGASAGRKDETSIPVPETPYGGSKLVAEKIHLAWQAAGADRRILIIRPGVVFGPGEGGNVTRLVSSVIHRYFVYLGNRNTLKAGGYVKELCLVIQFALEYQDRSGEALTMLNFSMDPPRSIEGFVRAIRQVANISGEPRSLPKTLLMCASYPIDAVARLIGVQLPISPVRVQKVSRSTNIDPKRLRELGYIYKYSLEQAFEDWKRDKPEDFA